MWIDSGFIIEFERRSSTHTSLHVCVCVLDCIRIESKNIIAQKMERPWQGQKQGQKTGREG